MRDLQQAISRAVKQLGYEDTQVVVEHPKDEKNGDYSTNVAMVLAKVAGKNPRELAEKLITSLQNDAELHILIEKIEVAGAGFINFFLRGDWLQKQLAAATRREYGMNQNEEGRKEMVEYTDPNPFKEFHIGHLMSNTIGESIARLKEAQGAEVRRACYQGDVGLHVAKAIWGMRKKLTADGIQLTDVASWDLNKKQRWMGKAYADGATMYETETSEGEAAKKEMQALNAEIYQRSDAKINELYDWGRQASLEYFETIYARLGTKFDEYFFESEAGKVGLTIVAEALQQGILETGEEGAIVYKGEKDGLHTRVFRNKLGLPTYEAKDLALPTMKYARYPYDESLIVTANEIAEYFKVVLKVLEKIRPELRAKTKHLAHGMMKLTTGKMSSRTGNVVTGEALLNDLRQVVLAKMGEREFAKPELKETIADQVAVGALKYTVLKQQIGGDIVYDPVAMTNLDGNTGPYVQYACTRAKSILRKFKPTKDESSLKGGGWNKEEKSLLRWIYRYPEVVAEAGKNLAPHLVATYIYELASRFNAFYHTSRVEEAGEVNQLRYQLTAAVARIFENGLGILGIVAPEEM